MVSGAVPLLSSVPSAFRAYAVLGNTAGPASVSRSSASEAANAFQEDRQRCMSAGMDGFLAKPVDFEALQALQAVLEQWLPINSF